MSKIIQALLILFALLSALCYSQDLSDIRIGIVHSELTKELVYPDDKNFYPVRDWEIFFLDRKTGYQIITDDDLEDNDLDNVNVLILPSVEVLSSSASVNLKRFLNSGKGLLVCGKLGEYDTDGRRRKEGFLSNAGGFNYEDLETGNNISQVHSLNISSVLCKGLKYDDDLLILNNYKPLVVKTISEKINSVGEFILKQKSSDKENNPGIIYSEDKGKIVWCGFQLSQVGSEISRGSTFERLLFNSIEWLSQKPVVMLKTWPGHFEFPVLITNTIIDTKIITRDALKQYKTAGIKENFFIELDALANSDEQFLMELDTLGEVNLLLKINPGNNASINSKLSQAYDKIYRFSDQNYFGIKLNNIYSGNLPDDVLSTDFKFFETADNKILLSSRSHSKDIATFQLPIKTIQRSVFGERVESVIESLSLLKEDLIREKKLLVLNLLNQIKTGRDLGVLNQLSALKDFFLGNNSWITTYSELIEWLLNREKIIITTGLLKEENNFEIKVENRNQDEIRDIVLLLFPPAGKYNPKPLQSEIKIDYKRIAGAYYITIPSITAGTQQVIKINFSAAD